MRQTNFLEKAGHSCRIGLVIAPQCHHHSKGVNAASIFALKAAPGTKTDWPNTTKTGHYSPGGILREPYLPMGKYPNWVRFRPPGLVATPPLTPRPNPKPRQFDDRPPTTTMDAQSRIMPTDRLLGSTRMAILLKTVTGVKHGGTRQLHVLFVNLLSKWLRRAKIRHMGGVGGPKRTCKGLITEFVNQLPKPEPYSPAHAADLLCRQGITPDLMLDATSLNPSENVSKILRDRTLADMKTLAPDTAYSESTSTVFSHSAEKRQKQVSPASTTLRPGPSTWSSTNSLACPD